MKNEKWCVYCHTNIKNNKKYFGITSNNDNPQRRWRKEGYGYKLCTRFYSAIQKYGWDGFEHEIIFKNLTEKEAKSKEVELIAYQRNKFGEKKLL